MGACFGVLDGPPFGVFDHQVAVERHGGRPPKALHHGKTNGEVGDEVIVHHVDVQPVGVRLHGTRLIGETGKVSGKDAGRDHQR